MNHSIPKSATTPSLKKVEPRIRAGVKALIVHQQKILIIYEKLANGEIICDFPGGGMDYGETIEETLKREVKEEVGIEIELVKPVGNWSFILTKHKVQILCLGYQCRVKGSIKLDFSHNPAKEDIIKAGWYTQTELLNDDKLLRLPEIKEAVKLLEI